MVELILEKIISWGVPVICIAVVTYLIKPFLKTHKKGQEIEDQEEWDNHSSKMKTALEGQISTLENKHDEDTSDLSKRIQVLENRDQTTQILLETILAEVKGNNTEFQNSFQAMDKKNTEAFVQIYQRDLIVDGKTYINNKKWTPNQKSNFKKRYEQYKAWGGNGDMEPWIEKLNRLPIEYPEIEDFVEK